MGSPAGSGRVPVFARWHDGTGAAVDAVLQWHSALPATLPEGSEEALCIVRLYVAAPHVEVLEAWLQLHHLQQPLKRWSPQRLGRLMAAMAQPVGPKGACGDGVVLRRETGRMVIDVLFGAGAGGGPAQAHADACRAVEILNAYPSGTSLRGSVTGLLRSVAAAQRAHRRRIAESHAELEELRSGLLRLEGHCVTKCEEARHHHQDSLRRFALLLQAKIDKEKELYTEAKEYHWAEQNTAVVSDDAVCSTGNSLLDDGQPQVTERQIETVCQVDGTERLTPTRRKKQSTLKSMDPVPANTASHNIPQAQNQPQEAILPVATTALSLLDPGSSDDEAPSAAAGVSRLRGGGQMEMAPMHSLDVHTHRQSALTGILLHSDED